MKPRIYVFLALVLALIAISLVLLKKNEIDSETVASKVLSRESRSSNKKETSHAVKRRKNQKTESNAITKREDRILFDLREAYHKSLLPAQLRLQSELVGFLEEFSPPPERFLGEIVDYDAPEEYRLFLAKLLRNQQKNKGFDQNQQSDVIRFFQSEIGNNEESPLFRARLANILASIDQSEPAANVIASLLDTDDETVAIQVVSALASMTNQSAAESLYGFVEEHANTPDEMPTAVTASLTPLIMASHNTDAINLASKILKNTDNFQVYSTCISILGIAPPSKALLHAIGTAFVAARRFPEHRDEAEALCHRSILKHGNYIANHMDEVPESLGSISAEIKHIPNPKNEIEHP